MRRPTTGLTIRTGLALAAILLGGLWMASDAPAEYTPPITLAGDEVQFVDVIESSLTDPVPLYGTPTVSGNTLLLAPRDFGSFASAGGVDPTIAKLSTTIEALPGTHLLGIRWSQFGDVALGGAGTADTGVTITAPVFLRIDEINGAPVSGLSFTANVAFSNLDGSNAGGQWNLADDGPLTGQVFRGDLDLDLGALLAGEGLSGGVTKLYFSVDNVLSAQSESGTYAYIMNTQLSGIEVLTSTPEPSTVLMTLIATAATAIWVRRRRPR